MLGVAIQNRLSVAALIMGWGIAKFAIMIITVAVYAYSNNCFPRHQVWALLFRMVHSVDKSYRVKSAL